VALDRPEGAGLLELYRKNRVFIVASLPSIASSQTDAMRGSGVSEKSIAVLKQLNRLGYGLEGSGLELDIAANPSGAYLPVSQNQAEERFRNELHRKHGIFFNSLFTFANVPLGRFRSWLEHSGNLDDYLIKLKERFNPCAVSGLMCCSLISVNWDGYIYDCDFNLAAEMPHCGTKKHITTLTKLPRKGTPISSGDHCFACTAGAGFTCGGSIAA
jgi:radical SAM/Cys-rich protein